MNPGIFMNPGVHGERSTVSLVELISDACKDRPVVATSMLYQASRHRSAPVHGFSFSLIFLNQAHLKADFWMSAQNPRSTGCGSKTIQNRRITGRETTDPIRRCWTFSVSRSPKRTPELTYKPIDKPITCKEKCTDPPPSQATGALT